VGSGRGSDNVEPATCPEDRDSTVIVNDQDHYDEGRAALEKDDPSTSPLMACMQSQEMPGT
jgi:hypothetical protein